MARIQFTGPWRHRLRGFAALNRIALGVYARHLVGRTIADDWDANMEIGIRFWRHQFTKAMKHGDIRQGRTLYNSLQTLTDDVYAIKTRTVTAPAGRWFVPPEPSDDVVLLYFHGGGYTFGGPNAARFAAMLAHHGNARLFMPLYRRTPEHRHPAQRDDALSAWAFVRKAAPDKKIMVIGDSAGGHMALSLLQTLRQNGQAQPELCIALCPWVDIAATGGSMISNDHFDLVQGWMAQQFGEWLDPEGAFGREALSPICQDFSGLAPIYLQVGGREIFRDPVLDFAKTQADRGAHVMLDVWDDMPHDFQAYDSMFASSTEALRRIHAAVNGHTLGPDFDGPTRVATGCFQSARLPERGRP